MALIGLAAVALAQPGGQSARALGPDEAPRIRRARPGGVLEEGAPIVQVELPLFRGRRTVALPAPFDQVEVYEVGEEAFVLVCGGTGGGSLEFLVVDRRTGNRNRIVRPGAIRLPSDFVGMPSSAPLVLPDGVFLIAWDEGGVLRFRVRNASVSVGGSGLEVPLTAAEVESWFDGRRRELGLAFRGRDGAIVASFAFPHPIAPIATLSVGSDLDFGRALVGERRSRRILLRNEGEFPLRGFLSIGGEGFDLAGTRPSEIEIEPGGFTILGIDWLPIEAGEAVGQLRLRAEVERESRIVRLAGQALAAAVEANGPPAGPSEIASARSELPDDRVEAPDLRQFSIRWLEPGWIEVRGRLETPTASVFTVESQREQSLTVAIDEGGSFRSILPAEVGDRIELRWLGDDRRVFGGRVAASAFAEGRRLHCEVRPGTVVAMVERLEAPNGGVLEGRAFLRRADARGRAEFTLPAGSSSKEFCLKQRGPDGRFVLLPLVDIPDRRR